MAASPPLHDVNDLSEKISVMEAESSVSKDEETVKDDTTSTNEPESEEQFKKPTLFAAPSLSCKRENIVSSKITTNEVSVKDSDTADAKNNCDKPAPEREVIGKETEHEKRTEEDKRVSTLKDKSKVKPKVLPVKGPQPGKFPPLPYAEPPWGGTAPSAHYALEILKNGTIVDTVPLTCRSFFVVGRLPVCDVTLEHPSISRYHAVIQYRGQEGDSDCVGEERGFYIHDLGSTHGTVVNKNRIPHKTYVRLRVGHVLKFGGSTRLFILQGPEFDEEEESALTVTELREQARKQRAELEKRMMGDGSDDDDDEEKKEEENENRSRGKLSEDSGCSWGMADEVLPEEDENEENPFSTEFQEDQEAAYLKDPKKALQGFYDREGEELEFDFEDKGHGIWLCRIKLPVDDALGRQLVAEVTHTGRKKEASVQCCLEACRMLEARGLLRQEAVSRKRKKKNWEDEDYYDSDDDTFLDRTGTVERKRQERMKKAGKIEERPETYESLVAKLSSVERELDQAQKQLSTSRGDSSGPSTEDSLEAFMTAVTSKAPMDAVERRKLHVHVADLRKEVQRLQKLVELTRPAQMPSLMPSGSSQSEKPKKNLPLFGAMKGGSKFKLKTGTIGKLPPKRPNLPAELFNTKQLPSGGEVEEEEEEEPAQTKEEQACSPTVKADDDEESTAAVACEEERTPVQKEERHSDDVKESTADVVTEPTAEPIPRRKKKVYRSSKAAVQLSAQYPDDDPDYSVWVPPSGQTGDGRTHLNDKYGY